jgi:gliding motility-associated-like protein
MTTGVERYEVFCSINLGPAVYIGDTTATTFFHRGLSSAQGINYCYYVRARSNGKTPSGKNLVTSTSNRSCQTVNGAPLPTLAYLSNVTVNPQQTVDISWFVNNTDPIGGFNLYRSTSKTGTYSLINNQSFTRGYGNYSFTDTDVNTNSTEYFYYVVVLDSACKLPTKQTDISNSIVLGATATPNLTATLNWNNYAKYAGNVTGYNVYRSVNGIFSSPVAFVPSGTNVYVDDLSPYADKEGMFVYYVEAVEGSGDSYGFAEKSTSNYDTVYVDANIYIPNAFVTYGTNKIFLPIGAFVDDADYKLSIYDRWGAKIYETTNVNQGWDGTGHPEAVYAYTVQYKTSVGEFRQVKGTVTLIR